MIPLDATLTACRLYVSRIVLTPHDVPMDADTVRHYRNLLRDNPHLDTDPIVVVPHNGSYTPTNGRHRYLAHVMVGRKVVPVVIVQT